MRKDSGRTRRDKNKTAKWQDKTRRRDVVCGRESERVGRMRCLESPATLMTGSAHQSADPSTNYKLRYTILTLSTLSEISNDIDLP